MKNLKSKIAVIVIIALIGSGVAYYLTREDHKSITKSVPAVTQSAVIAHKTHAVTVPHAATVIPVAKPVKLLTVGFKFNTSGLSSNDISKLNKVISFAKKNPNSSFVVNGYCSKMGSYSYNQKLSVARALSVGHYLESKGISSKQLKLVGHSYHNPIATNATPHGRLINQRVTIVATK
jgi:OOP family OmpA-OmpF porin